MDTSPFDENVLERARRGTDEDWAFIDTIDPAEFTEKRVNWAREVGLMDENQNFRDFCATVIARSNVSIDRTGQNRLVVHMTDDDYEPVRHWLASALYKRGNRDPEVVAMWQEACEQDTPAGAFARSLQA